MEDVPSRGMHTDTHTHIHTHSLTFIHTDIHTFTGTYTHPYIHTQSHPLTHTSVVRGWGRRPSLPCLASLHLLLVPGNVSCSFLRFGWCQDLLLLKHYQQFAWVSLNSFLVQPFQLNHSTPVCPSPRLAGYCVRWWAVRQLQNKKRERDRKLWNPHFIQSLRALKKMLSSVNLQVPTSPLWIIFFFSFLSCEMHLWREERKQPQSCHWLMGVDAAWFPPCRHVVSVEAALADSLSISFHVNFLEQVSAVNSDVGPHFQHSPRPVQCNCSKCRLTHQWQ